MNENSDPKWLTPQYWQSRFDSGDTPWELGRPSVVLLEAFEVLKSLGAHTNGMTVLSPGCGRGSDALALVEMGARVVGVDWSPTAVVDLRARYARLPGPTGSLEVIAGDFFAIPPQRLDCVAEHTFFCAIDPSARPRYVERIVEWIRPGGFLVGNFFVVPGEVAATLPGLSLTQSGEGPPFATTVAELESLFSPYFITKALRPAARQEPDRRLGMEWIGVFQRSTNRT